MWWYADDISNWAAVRLLDSAARGDDMPGWADEAGWLLIGLAAAVSLWLGIRWLRQRREERSRPVPGSLLDARPWLAEEGEVDPRYRYRGRRRKPRNHVVPAHPPRADVVATQVIPRVSDDIDSTAVLTRPRGRWGSR